MNQQVAGKLTSSLEDYLEAILFLVRRDRVARVRDIAAQLKVGMPSVSSALKALAARKLVNYDPYQFVTLTDQGSRLAEQVSRKHFDLMRFLMDVLGLDAAEAEANACRMEHAMDEPALERLRLFGQFIARCPRAGAEWIAAFQHQCLQGPPPDPAACGKCAEGIVGCCARPAVSEADADASRDL